MLQRIIATAVPRATVLEAHPLRDGLRNANFKVLLDIPPQAVVLRIYEHDPSLWQKEIDLLRLVSAVGVPVPEILYAEPGVTVLRWIEAITLLDLKRAGDCAAIAQAAQSAGEVLAAIGRTRFDKSGWIAPGPTVTAPLLEGDDPVPRFIDQCLASSHQRLPQDLRPRVSELAWRYAPQLSALDGDPRLVHGDFGKRNLLVYETAGRWRVAAVLDWEFAIAASPLNDIANLLRYEREERPLLEPHFSAAYENAGGVLPPNWRALARVLDLTALCSSLAAAHELPDDVAPELAGLVRATVLEL
jgi:aminoglycoside phosphotransferase (APT) family kinase protein